MSPPDLLAELENLVECRVSDALLPEAQTPSAATSVPDHERAPGVEVLTRFKERETGLSVEEELLHRLVGAEWNVQVALSASKNKLALRLDQSIDDPRAALLVAKVLRDVIFISASLTKRIESMLLASASLRGQRRVLALHRGEGRPDGV